MGESSVADAGNPAAAFSSNPANLAFVSGPAFFSSDGEFLLQDAYQFVSFDPKIPLVEGRLALFSPIGVFFNDPFPGEVESIDVFESLQVHPSLIATIPLGRPEQHLNLGVRGIIVVDDPAEYLTGINLGLRLTPDEETGGHEVPSRDRTVHHRRRQLLLPLGHGPLLRLRRVLSAG